MWKIIYLFPIAAITMNLLIDWMYLAPHYQGNNRFHAITHALLAVVVFMVTWMCSPKKGITYDNHSKTHNL